MGELGHSERRRRRRLRRWPRIQIRKIVHRPYEGVRIWRVAHISTRVGAAFGFRLGKICVPPSEVNFSTCSPLAVICGVYSEEKT